MLLLLPVSSLTLALNRLSAAGAIRRLSSLPHVKLKLRNFRSCGFPTALFFSLTLSLSFLEELLDAFHHPLPCPFGLDVDVAVVCVPNEVVAAFFKLLVEIIEHDV